MADEYREAFRVEKNDCISNVDNSLPNLLGTYTLVKWMELVSAKNIKKILPKGYLTVGEKVNIDHIGMVKLGEVVEVVSTVVLNNGKKVLFNIKAEVNQKTIARATHQQAFVSRKFIKRIMCK